MMGKKDWRVSVFILACLAGEAPVHGETLEQAMMSAYQSNPTLLSERSKLRATDELVPQALLNWRPTVTVSGNATRSNTYTYINSGSTIGGTTSGTPQGTQVTSAGTLVYNAETMGLQVTQPIFRGGRTVAQTRQAEAQVEAERAQLSITEQQILLNV